MPLHTPEPKARCAEAQAQPGANARPPWATYGLLLFYQMMLVLFGCVYLVVRFLRGRASPGLRQRLAWYPKALREKLAALNGPIWIHMVSVGEVMAAAPLIEALRQALPEKRWLFSTVTPTGRSVAERMIRPGEDQLLYLPWDLGPVVNRAVREIRPCLFLSFETELWPVLFHRLGREGIPVVVVNGRISPSTLRSYLWIRFFMRRALWPVRAVLTQSPQDAQRFASIGVPEARVAVTGNLKWDLAPQASGDGAASDQLRSLLNLTPEDILWTAGSTHSGEERMVLETYQKLKLKHSNLRFLIAPRHPERADQVEQEARRIGLAVVRRSALDVRKCLTLSYSNKDRPGTEEPDPVILLDTFGELATAYAASEIVFVGGSLIPHGGHNLVEPAGACRPILTGFHLYNFQAISEALTQTGGMTVVRSQEELRAQVERLLKDPDLRRQMGQKAFAAIEKHKGATERTSQWILKQWTKELSAS